MTDRVVVGWAVAAMVVVYTRSVVSVVGCGLALGVVPRRRGFGNRSRRALATLAGIGALALLAVHGRSAWDGNVARRLGTFTGWVEVVDDPQPYGRTTRVLLAVDGQRYECWVRGRAARQRVSTWSAGDEVRVGAQRFELKPERKGRVVWQHVVGTVELDWVGDRNPARGLAGASNRIRSVLEAGSTELPTDRAALFRGLVIGDDADEPPEMLARFRGSGLSHLTAVSGQNVVFVLAAASPVLRRLRPWPRWLLTIGLIGWFVALTRFEPSIVRAGTMAAISATGFVLGQRRSPIRILALAVIVLVVLDPLIVYSVGFLLSVGATAGVAGIGPWLAARMGGLGWLAEPVAVTLGAQVGVVVPSVLIFGRLPLVSLPANLLAVPAAGFVMLYGLPAGLIAGAIPALAPVVMFPCRVGVSWVDSVAVVAAAIEPSPRSAAIGWAGIVVVVTSVLIRNRRSDRATLRPRRATLLK